ncbi:hypothetical protein [Streptomyces wuyuanensis]
MVERLVPDESWGLFRRVLPPMDVKRPQGGAAAGDHETVAAVV